VAFSRLQTVRITFSYTESERYLELPDVTLADVKDDVILVVVPATVLSFCSLGGAVASVVMTSSRAVT